MLGTLARKTAAVLGALTLGCVLAAGLATSASAAQTSPDHSCDAGDFCVFTDYIWGDAGGQTWAWQGDDLDWCYHGGPCNNDHSWENAGNLDGSGYYDVVIYNQGNHSSGSVHNPTLCVPLNHTGAGYEVPSADGQGSAHRWVRGGCPGGVPVLS
ncbi:MAG TPA: hypothetical protein VF069_13055 [Streptosporangiaceae bacterium]